MNAYFRMAHSDQREDNTKLTEIRYHIHDRVRYLKVQAVEFEGSFCLVELLSKSEFNIGCCLMWCDVMWCDVMWCDLTSEVLSIWINRLICCNMKRQSTKDIATVSITMNKAMKKNLFTKNTIENLSNLIWKENSPLITLEQENVLKSSLSNLKDE
jgi:hypothetical protein